MGKINFLFKYLSYLVSSKDEHALHSPFVFDLYTQAIKPQKKFYIYSRLESLRKELLASQKEIGIIDYGAGSKIDNSGKRTIASIAKHSEKPPHLAQLLFRLIDYLKPQVLIDLGTSFGITTLYQASVNSKSMVYTFEGSPETCAIARNNFKKMQCMNIELIEGNIDVTLREKIREITSIDYVFFDANHRYGPTINYFTACMEKAHEDTLFVFDDIHWSDEMEKAWEEIKNHPRVTLTIDLFFVGLVFFRNKQPKQHFILKL